MSYKRISQGYSVIFNKSVVIITLSLYSFLPYILSAQQYNDSNNDIVVKNYKNFTK